jgi:hypothetical protein
LSSQLRWPLRLLLNDQEKQTVEKVLWERVTSLWGRTRGLGVERERGTSDMENSRNIFHVTVVVSLALVFLNMYLNEALRKRE